MLYVKEILKKLIFLLKKLIKREEKHVKLYKEILSKLEKIDKENNRKK